MSKYINGLVSVIIPTYKRSSMLLRSINSALSQTYDNIEVLIIDDNVPGDKHSQRIGMLIDSISDERVKLIKQKTPINAAVARNKGIHNARGEYIAFLDDDDLWCKNKIELQIKKLLELDESYGGISTLKAYVKDSELIKISNPYRINNQSERILSKNINISTCTVLLKHKCLDETGYFDENLNRHQEVQLFSYFTQKYKIHLIKEVLTIITFDDISNQPSIDGIIGIKEDFLKAVNPLMKNYSNRKRRKIKNLHWMEVAWVYYRDGYKLKGISMLIKCFSSPSVIIELLNRYYTKKKEINNIKKFERKAEILNFIESCSKH